MPLIPLVLPSSSSAVGTSTQAYRNRLARRLGYYATGTTTTQAASLEAERYVISSSIRSDGPAPEHWDGLYVYIRDGDQAGVQRKVMAGGFEGTNGVLTLDYPLPAALATGVSFEISVLPAVSYLGAGGLNEILTEALEELPIIDYLPVTVTETGGIRDTEYAMIGYPWPIKTVEAVAYPRASGANEARREIPPWFWTYDQDAEAPVLSFTTLPATVGDTLEVRVHRPASTRIRVGGTWGDSTVGLVNESDQALYDTLTVANVAHPKALERMALLHQRGSPDRLSLEVEASALRRAAAITKFYGRFRRSGLQRVGAR